MNNVNPIFSGILDAVCPPVERDMRPIEAAIAPLAPSMWERYCAIQNQNTKTDTPVVVKRSYAVHGEADSIYVEINGGMSNDGVTVRIGIPIGHSVDQVCVELSCGNGWKIPTMEVRK